MSSFFIVIGILAFFAGLFITPIIMGVMGVARKKENEAEIAKLRKARNIFAIAFFAGLVSCTFGLMIDGSGSKDKTKSIASVENKAPEVANTQADLPFTVDEFKSQFNAAAHEFKNDNIIGDIEVVDGMVNNSATITLDNNSSLVLAINKKTGKVVGITLIGVPDKNDPQGGLKVIVEMGILIAASNPELTPDDRGGIFKSLGLMDKNLDLSNYKKNYIKDNIKYFIVTSTVTGVMFGLESANTSSN